MEVPDCASHIHANQTAVGDLAFFHFSVLKYDANGRPMLRPTKLEHEKACCNINPIRGVVRDVTVHDVERDGGRKRGAS